MVYRQFGNTSLRVSEIGLGCSQLGGTSNSDKQVLRTLLEAFDQGVNFFDTADVYAQGRSEQLLGQAFKRNRANIILATKAGYHLTSAGKLGARLKPVLRPALQLISRFRRNIQGTAAAPKRQTFSPAYLRKAIEGSLRRLQTDYLDIFQLHSPSSEVIVKGEFIEALESAKSQGKIRSYGVSCRTVDDARLCLRYSNLSAVQIPISLLQFDGVPSFLELSKRAKVGVIARQPFASGFLARTANSKSKHASVPEARFTHHAELAKAFEFLEQNNDRTIAQAALEFVLRLPGVSLVIAGMNSREHLNENLAASKRPLTSDEIARIYAVFDQAGKTRAINI
jgi:aryl-alcohol dehydrogenase-like predicted oxidoreductase